MIAINVCTTTERALFIQKEQFPKNDLFVYYISVQGTSDTDSRALIVEHLSYVISRPCVSFNSNTGLSNNRNNALVTSLKNLNVNYIYIADDDIKIRAKNLINATNFAEINQSSLVSGMVSTPKGMYKKYPNSKIKLNIFSVAKVSSVEMIISADLIRKKSIFFNEQFGLGAKYTSGEEYILSTSILRVGGDCVFLPIILCEHPPESSGKDFFSDVTKIQAKGAMFKSIFGLKAYIFCIYFSLSKYKAYKKNISFMFFLINIFKGCYEYKKKL
jgi:hypothetical protein